MRERDPEVRAAIVGCGRYGRSHIRQMLSGFRNTDVAVLCTRSPESYAEAAEVFEENDRPAPPYEPDLKHLLDKYGDELDAALIATPHAMHCSQAKACLEADVDVLVEKPR